MLKASWKSLLARKLRLTMSAFAIILGVAFVAGSFIFTDTLGRTFGGIVEGSVGDVVIRPAGLDSFEDQSSRTIPAGVVADLEQVEGVARVDGNVTYMAAFVIDKSGKLIGGTGAPALGVNHTGGPAAGGNEFGTVASGRTPERPGEVALDTATAKKAGYAIGEWSDLTAGDRRTALRSSARSSSRVVSSGRPSRCSRPERRVSAGVTSSPTSG